jgi:CheY-like chemotaxis protein
MLADQDSLRPPRLDEDAEIPVLPAPALLPRLAASRPGAARERRRSDAARGSRPSPRGAIRRDARTPIAVLVVEPDRVVGPTLCRMLTRLGMAPLHARDVRSARALAASAPSIDVLFTELELTDGSGVTLVDELRARFAPLRVVLGAELGAEMPAWWEQPWCALVRKPFGARDLMSQIDRMAPRRARR